MSAIECTCTVEDNPKYGGPPYLIQCSLCDSAPVLFKALETLVGEIVKSRTGWIAMAGSEPKYSNDDAHMKQAQAALKAGRGEE